MVPDRLWCMCAGGGRAGFREVKEVTNEVQFLPDLLVWGGVGTRMDMEVREAEERTRLGGGRLSS